MRVPSITSPPVEQTAFSTIRRARHRPAPRTCPTVNCMIVTGNAESVELSGINGENAFNAIATGSASSGYSTKPNGYSPQTARQENRGVERSRLRLRPLSPARRNLDARENP